MVSQLEMNYRIGKGDFQIIDFFDEIAERKQNSYLVLFWKTKYWTIKSNSSRNWKDSSGKIWKTKKPLCDLVFW